MTSHRIVRLSVILCLSLVCAGLMPGCGGGAADAIPETTIVELPDGTTQEVSLGAGVASLANTTWRFNRVVGDGFVPFATVSFGPQGNLTSFENNTLAPEIFGDTLLFDGKEHATSQQGLTYVAGTFGAETNDATGFAFEAVLAAFFGIAGQVATGNANASGTFDADNPDRMTGTISINTEVTLPLGITFPGAEDANVDEEFAFFGVRLDNQ